MADEEELGFDELEEPDDLEAVELDELEDEELADDDDAEDVVVDEAVLTDDVLDDTEVVEPVETVVAEEDDDEDDDEDVDPDEVEAGLDVILKDRLVVEDEDEEEEEEPEGPPDPEERAEGSAKVVPKRPEEFVCESCFLVKHPSQLADSKRMLCRDCV